MDDSPDGGMAKGTPPPPRPRVVQHEASEAQAVFGAPVPGLVAHDPPPPEPTLVPQPGISDVDELLDQLEGEAEDPGEEEPLDDTSAPIPFGDTSLFAANAPAEDQGGHSPLGIAPPVSELPPPAPEASVEWEETGAVKAARSVPRGRKGGVDRYAPAKPFERRNLDDDEPAPAPRRSGPWLGLAGLMALVLMGAGALGLVFSGALGTLWAVRGAGSPVVDASVDVPDVPDAPAVAEPEAVETAPSRDAAYQRGRDALEAKDPDAAEQAFLECLSVAPDDVECRYELGWAHWLREDWPAVVSVWTPIAGHEKVQKYLPKAQEKL